MSTLRLYLLISGLLFTLISPAMASASGYTKDPARWDSIFQKYRDADQTNPPPTNAILCIGSSSMHGWHKHLAKDLSPLTVIPRGFGGSNMKDAVYAVDRIVLPYQPRAILFYEGDNDIAERIQPEEIASTFQLFADKVWETLPETRIYVISIKPSIRRFPRWGYIQQANQLLQEICEQDSRLTFIDVATPMLNGEGTPRKELIAKDNLHMTREGYLVWKEVIRPILIDAEQQYEKP